MCEIKGLHEKGIMAVRFDEAGERLLLGSADKSVSVLDATNLHDGTWTQIDSNIDCNHTNGVIWSMNFSADASLIVLGSSDSVASVVHLDSRTNKLTLHGIHNDGITSACFNPGGDCIATGSGSGAKTASLHFLPCQWERPAQALTRSSSAKAVRLRSDATPLK